MATDVASGQRPLSGIALVILATLCFASMDTAVRRLGQSLPAIPVLLMLWCRYAIQAGAMALVLAWLWRRQPLRRPFASAHPRFQLLRGGLLLGTSAAAFIGLQRMPVPEFTAIVMLTPVLVTLLSALVLHEKVSALRWVLVVGALVGAWVVIRPGSGLFGAVALFPLAGALSYAGFQVLTRRLSSVEDPLTTHFYTGLVGTALVSPVLLASGGVHSLDALGSASGQQLAGLLLIGALGTGGHLVLILALARAPTATLMPFNYLQIGFAAALAWLVWGQLPDAWGWVGMAIIAACGAASAWLNMRAASQAARGARPPLLEADSCAD